MTASLALVNFNSKEVEPIQAEAALRCNGYQQPAGIGGISGSFLRLQLGREQSVRFARSSIRKQTVRSRPSCCRSEGGDGRLKAAAAAITVFVSVYQK
jgi:hypothetical protein